MSPEVETVAGKVLAARCAEDVFGTVKTAAEVTRDFRAMARILHPDVAGPGDRPRDAMGALLRFRAEAERKMADGTWGQKAPAVAVEIRAGHLYAGVRPLAAGDICDVYAAEYDEGGKTRRAAIKLLRDPADDDLSLAEWRTLQKLWAFKDDDAVSFQRYLARPIEAAKINVAGKTRRANVFKLAARTHSIGEVMLARPRGLDPRDMAWMLRRIFEGLSWIHSKGIVHGAILPEHVLVRPEDHGAKLVGWSCSVEAGRPIRAISAAREAFYPPEVLAKKPATPATDIFMAAGIARALTRDADMPPKVGALLKACLLPSPHARYGDAAEVYRRLDAVLRELYGKPTFRPFSLLPA